MLENVNPKSPLANALNRVPFILQIVIGLCLGILLAWAYPDDKTVIPALGSLFVKALKAIAPLLVFVLVAAAIAKQDTSERTSLKTVIALYVIGMVLASTLALVMSYLFPSTFTELADEAKGVTPPQGIKDVLINFVNQAVDNPVNALMTGNYIGILVWSSMFGVMFRFSHDATKKVLDDLAQCVSGVVRMVVRCAPLGVLGLVYSSCTQEGGFANLLNYVHVVVVLVATMLMVAFIINPIIVFACTRKNPFPLIGTCIANSHQVVSCQPACEHGAVPEARAAQADLLDLHSAGLHHQHVRRRGDHRRHDHGRRQHRGRPRRLRLGASDVHRLGDLRLRHLRHRRRLAHADPACLLDLRHKQRHRDAGRGHRLHHRRDPGLH